MPDADLTRIERATILRKLSEAVEKHFYDPGLCGVDWAAAVTRHRDTILDAPDSEAFELAATALLNELNSSHVGFFRQRPERASARMAISATYSSVFHDGEDRWVFQVVHDGGPGAKAGLRPGDVLLAVDNRNFRPPEHPIFPLASTCTVSVLTDGLKHVVRELTVPPPVHKKYQLPYVEPTLVHSRCLRHDLGYLRISMFPGLVGIDVANEISQAIQQLNGVERLIIDLRGNSGGGLAVIRVMSLLTAERIPIGYSLHRCQAGMSPSHQNFPVFDRVPSDKKWLHWLRLKYGWRLAAVKLGLRVKPILLQTEGLVAQPFVGRVVLLVDRHTASASEMIAAFARENHLAVLVGEPTAGRLLNGDEAKLSAGYRVVFPIGSYHTARGWSLEGNPIEPDIHIPFDPSEARAGNDPQLEKAIEVVSEL